MRDRRYRVSRRRDVNRVLIYVVSGQDPGKGTVEPCARAHAHYACFLQILSADHAEPVLHHTGHHTGVRVGRDLGGRHILRARPLDMVVARDFHRQQLRSFMGQPTVQQVRATLLGSRLRDRHRDRPA